MTIRPAIALALAALLAGCMEGEVPIYVGSERVGTLPGTRAETATNVTTVASSATAECQQLAQRVLDTSLTDAQRLAAANYAASLGC